MTAALPLSASPRVLYLPNEIDLSPTWQQVGGRRVFAELAQEGAIRELAIDSFLADYRIDRVRRRSQQRLLEVIAAFQPDIIFWQHPQDFPIDAGFLREVRRRSSNVFLVYHEGDPFNSFWKRALESEQSLYRACDVFFTVALGGQRRLFEKLGAHRHFYYSPTFFNRERVGSPPNPNLVGSRYDAVMIGSIAHRMRVLRQPGSPERIALARGLARSMGNRFAVFGAEWPKMPCHGGFLDPLEQTRTIQSARMSVIWENFPEHTFYYSDRLPISIASGIPHITSRRPGYDILFGKTPGLFLADTIEDAVDIACYLRSLPLERIVELGLAARAWIFEHLEADRIFREAFALSAELWRRRGAAGSRPSRA